MQLEAIGAIHEAMEEAIGAIHASGSVFTPRVERQLVFRSRDN